MCDVDIVFLKNPFPHFKGRHDLYGVIDLQDAVHADDTDTVAVNASSSMFFCGGILFFRSTAAASLIVDHLIMKVFRAERVTGEENDQTFLRFVLINLSFFTPSASVAVLPQRLFPPGWLFFGNAAWRKEHRDDVVLVHNNWIRSKACKLLRWLQHGMWRVPNSDGAVPSLIWPQDNENDTVLGLRGVDWHASGISAAELPYNASDCRVGHGIIHRDELARWK